MAHELLIGEDGKASMLYVGEAPWHGLGEALANPPTAAEAIRAAGLDWKVVRAPLFYHESIARTGLVPNLFALVPDDRWPHGQDRPLFGVVTSKYRILQNRDAFAFFDPIVKRSYATYETAGALGKGERVWVMVKLRGDFEVAPGDTVQRYLLLSNSHDGKASVQVKFTPVRVVCQNTLTMALTDDLETFSVRHDPSLFDNLGAVADEMIGATERRYDAIQKEFARLARTTVDDAMLASYIAAVFPEPASTADGADPRTREEKIEAMIRDRWAVGQIYIESPRCVSAGRTLWAAYNAVTEYVDHWRPAGSRGLRTQGSLNRIWFGSGYSRKIRAFDEALRFAVN